MILEPEMIIKYSNGTEVEAALLVRGERTLRVALNGGDDVVEVTEINGTWVSEDCEPVQIEFAWELRGRLPEPTEADFVCSEELAARLLRLLFTDSSEDVEVSSPLDSPKYHVASRMIS